MGCLTLVTASCVISKDPWPFFWSTKVTIYGLITVEATNIQTLTDLLIKSFQNTGISAFRN